MASHCWCSWRCPALEVCPFLGEVTPRCLPQHNYFPRYPLDSWDPSMPNGGPPALTGHSSHTSFLIHLTLCPPINGSVACSQCGSHFFVLLLPWQPQLLDPWVSYPWNPLPGQRVFQRFTGHKSETLSVGSPWSFSFQAEERSPCHCGGGLKILGTPMAFSKEFLSFDLFHLNHFTSWISGVVRLFKKPHFRMWKYWQPIIFSFLEIWSKQKVQLGVKGHETIAHKKEMQMALKHF